MDTVIKNSESIDLNERDIKNICTPNNVKILFYSDLNNYDTIDELFNESDNIVILYRTNGNYGHWVALLNQGNNIIEFFDPYGMSPDYELRYAEESQRLTKMGDKQPHLTYLLSKARDDKKRITYNAIKLQEFHKDVNTCGRHVGVRIKLRHIDLHSYQKLLLQNNNNPDMTVTYLTYFLTD